MVVLTICVPIEESGWMDGLPAILLMHAIVAAYVHTHLSCALTVIVKWWLCHSSPLVIHNLLWFLLLRI